MALTHRVTLHQMVCRRSPACRLYQFLPSTSFSARLSKVSSASTCFSFWFSSPSCFSFLASLTSRPTYIVFHRYSVCSLIPCCRHSSLVFTPLSDCFRTPIICSSLWRRPRIFVLLSASENLHPIRYCWLGPGHTHL